MYLNMNLFLHSMKVSELQYLLESYEPDDTIKLRVSSELPASENGSLLLDVENIVLEIPEPISMFDDPERCCVLTIKEQS